MNGAEHFLSGATYALERITLQLSSKYGYLQYSATPPSPSLLVSNIPGRDSGIYNRALHLKLLYSITYYKNYKIQTTEKCRTVAIDFVYVLKCQLIMLRENGGSWRCTMNMGQRNMFTLCTKQSNDKTHKSGIY
jgi:hypothetical protein